MKKQDFFSLSLPKWPAMIVLGKNRVTKEQAAEIIVRTDSWNLCTNQHAFEKKLRNSLDLDENDYECLEKFREEYNVLPLNYLDNTIHVLYLLG